MTGKSLLITPPSEPSHTTASTRLLRSLKGVRHWWTPRHTQQNTQTAKEQQHSTHSEKDGIAMTLTATIGVKEDIQTTTALHYSGSLFIPTSNFDTTHSTVVTKTYSPLPSTYNARAFVHYDPSRSCLALGADPDSSQTQAIWLSLERYTWIISQLQEEQNVYTFLKNCSINASLSHGLSGQQQQNYRQSAPPPPSSGSCMSSSSPCLNWYPFLCTPSPIVGVLHPRCSNTTPLSRRLSRFVHRGSKKQQYHHHHHLPPTNEVYLFMIPKALLLQAAAYIPMTKPLPPMYASSEHKSPLPEKLAKQAPPTPFTELSVGNTQRLKRYVQLVSLTTHDLMATPTGSACEDVTPINTPIPNQHDQQTATLFDLICGRCGLNTSLGTVTSATSALSAAAAMEASHSLTTQNGTEMMEESTKDGQQQQPMPVISVSKTTLIDKKLVIDPTFTITYFQPILNTSTESAHLYGTPRPYSHSPLPINSTKKEREVTSTFNTFPKRQQQQQQSLNSGTHHGSIDHLSCSDSVSTSGVTSGSFSLTYQKTSTDDCSTGLSERKGYVAIDHTHQEIIVVFPGLPLGRNSTGGQIDMDPSFFMAVPWFEESQDEKNDSMDAAPAAQRHQQIHDPVSSPPPLNNHQQEDQQQRKRKTSRRRTILRKKHNEAQHDTESPSSSPASPPPPPSSSSSSSSSLSSLPWVLNGALTAWRRCELNVATLLMRACKSVPQHYRVIMVGSGLGSAIASLCALSLVSTGLLSDRSVTYCGIHPPRIGDHNFGQLLSNQNIETLRIMHPNDIMAHLPPRTSGMTHIGDTTIIDNKRWMIQGQDSPSMEDTIDRSLPAAKIFDLERYGWALDIDLYTHPCLSSLDLLTLP